MGLNGNTINKSTLVQRCGLIQPVLRPCAAVTSIYSVATDLFERTGHHIFGEVKQNKAKINDATSVQVRALGHYLDIVPTALAAATAERPDS